MTVLDLPLSAPVNLRDLGGVLVEGGPMRTGLTIRADDLAYVTAEVAEQLVDQGLAAIIDLRSTREAALTGRGPLAAHPVAYHHIPLIADVSRSVDDHHDFSHESMGRMYVSMVEDAAPQIVAALDIIARTPGTTAFHCAAGRDRTGVLAAMLLLVLGADDDAIVDDYSRTGENMAAIMARTKPVMGAMWQALGVEPDHQDTTPLLEGSMDVSMRMLLAELRARHADALAPLRAAGLSDDTVARLRGRALAG